MRARGRGDPLPGLPRPGLPTQGTPAPGPGGSPRGDLAPSTGRQLPSPAFPPCSVGLFPYGFPGLARSQPPPVPGGRAHLLLSWAAGPAAWSILAIFSTVVAARSRCRLFLASPATAAAGKGPRGVVLHCRCWGFGLAGAASQHVGPPWGAALVLLLLPGSLPTAVATHHLSGSQQELGLAESLHPKPLPASAP